MCTGRGQGYAGQGLALADVLAHLYFRVMRRRPDGSYLDRFVLSTGHSAIGLFAILGEVGLYEQEELRNYGQPGSRIEESPLEGTPGFEITGGSLGQGLSQAVGMALGERLHGTGANIYCLVSDGELQEGQMWEAAMSASHFRLGNLTVLVDNNNMQADGTTADVMTVEPVVERFASFGFDASRIDGHDHAQLEKALPQGALDGTGHKPSSCRQSLGRGCRLSSDIKSPLPPARRTHLVRRYGRARHAGGPKLRRGNEDISRTVARNPPGAREARHGRTVVALPSRHRRENPGRHDRRR